MRAAATFLISLIFRNHRICKLFNNIFHFCSFSIVASLTYFLSHAILSSYNHRHHHHSEKQTNKIHKYLLNFSEWTPSNNNSTSSSINNSYNSNNNNNNNNNVTRTALISNASYNTGNNGYHVQMASLLFFLLVCKTKNTKENRKTDRFKI